ncbi:GntR family transcriptional regulator [Castellaniella caeni]|uniref:GntR family transcriptional regulator n=1 Tax=Castellaniella caeni TaxID=266123 RepID=UPI000C9FC7A1|nr:GntR family transcriptional regulator [Castellaniella caeni]
MNAALSPLSRPETLSADALAKLKELLITGQVMPGETLPIRGTAEALGVSMMPVRQAIYQLVADRALEIGPSRSVHVPVMTQEEFAEVTKIRLCVEGFAVEMSAQSATAQLVSELREVNAALSQRMDEGLDGAAHVIVLNKQLHFSLYAAANMPLLTKIIEALWLRIGPVLNYDLRTGSERTRHKTAVTYHAQLLDAVAARDGTAARAALGRDIESAFQYICSRVYGAGDTGKKQAQPDAPA